MIIDPFTTNNRIYDRCYKRDNLYIPLMFLLIFFYNFYIVCRNYMLLFVNDIYSVNINSDMRSVVNSFFQDRILDSVIFIKQYYSRIQFFDDTCLLENDVF